MINGMNARGRFTFLCLSLCLALISSPSSAQSNGRIIGKYVGRIIASADAGIIYNLFLGDRDYDFRTEIQLSEDDIGQVTGSAQFIDQKNRRSVGNPVGQRKGSRLQFAIPLRENCGPINTRAVVSSNGDVISFPPSKQTVYCSGVGVRIALKAFTLSR